jgi:hypothetical protein
MSKVFVGWKKIADSWSDAQSKWDPGDVTDSTVRHLAHALKQEDLDLVQKHLPAYLKLLGTQGVTDEKGQKIVALAKPAAQLKAYLEKALKELIADAL